MQILAKMLENIRLTKVEIKNIALLVIRWNAVLFALAAGKLQQYISNIFRNISNIIYYKLKYT